MIDFHCHLLPALDDGAVSIDESLAMAKSLAAFGYKTVTCTPHCIKGYYDLSPHKVREATLMLQSDLDNAGIALELQPGMEYMLDECFSSFADDLLPLGNTRLVLCEAPHQAHPGFVRENLELILAKGFVPLIAHPERTEYFYQAIMAKGKGLKVAESKSTEALTRQQRSPGLLKRFFSRGGSEPLALNPSPERDDSSLPTQILFHANLGSFTGYYGEAVQRRAYELLKLNVYTTLASDLHDGGSVAKVLVHDKFAMNPLLKKLADFDGRVARVDASSGSGEQIGLF